MPRTLGPVDMERISYWAYINLTRDTLYHTWQNESDAATHWYRLGPTWEAYTRIVPIASLFKCDKNSSATAQPLCLLCA